MGRAKSHRPEAKGNVLNDSWATLGLKIKDFGYLVYTCPVRILYLMGSYGAMNWCWGFRSVTHNPFIVEYSPPILFP